MRDHLVSSGAVEVCRLRLEESERRRRNVVKALTKTLIKRIYTTPQLKNLNVVLPSLSVSLCFPRGLLSFAASSINYHLL